MDKVFEAKRVIVARFVVSGPDLRSIMEKVMEAKRDERMGGSMLSDMVRDGIDESDTLSVYPARV